MQRKNSFSSAISLRFQLAVVACILLLVNGCNTSEPEPETISLPGNESLRFSSQPIANRELLPLTSKPLDELDLATQQLNQQLQELAEYADTVRTSGGSESDIPGIFAQQFETTFLERNKLVGVFIGERIRIARWLVDEKTPTFFETVAVNRLFETLTKPWKDASRFRIEFLIHTINNRPNYFDAEVMVNIVGAVESPASRVSGQHAELGRTAIGLWQFVWQKGDSGAEHQIKKINMLAHEETLNYIGGGTLFRDCASSVLRNAPKTRNHLSYGLDAWARQIPGIDITGNCGLAIGDVNNDNLDDIYLCQPHGMPNLLLIQNPDGTADDVAERAGVDIFDHSSAALLIDIDNDRLQDLVVATDTRLVLYSNLGNGNFQLEHKLKIGHGTESLSAIDYDQDGDLDFYLTKFRPVSRFDDIFPQPKALMSSVNGGRNVLLRNDEAWQFKDVTSEVGLSFNNQHYTRAAIWNDFDSDGDFDLYHANEFHQDVIFENQDGWFHEVDKASMLAKSTNSTTVSTGDFNRDGKPDFFVGADAGFVARRITAEYIETGGKHLRDARGFGGVSRIYHKDAESALASFDLDPPLLSSQATFSSTVADFNNDGWEDVAVTNGWLSRGNQDKAESAYYRNLFDVDKDLDVAATSFALQHELSDLFRMGDSFNGYQRNCCFLGLGPLRFANYSNASGMDFLDDARAIASTDWDGDGDVDLIVTNRTGPRLRILRNGYSSKNQFLKLRLVGTESNNDAIGSRVEVYLRGSENPLVKMLSAGSGRCSQSSKELHFGLGKGTSIEKLIVVWPTGESQAFADADANKTYRIIEGKTELHEVADDRYRIGLDNNALEALDGIPPTERIHFFPSTRLPILQYRTEGNDRARWYKMENIDHRPLFCLFCPSRLDNTNLLRDWAMRERNFAQMNADMLAVFTGNSNDKDVFVKESADQISAASCNFRWGVLSESGNAKFAQLMGHWFFDQKLPDRPFGLLLDGDGNLHFAYREDQLKWKTVLSDLQNIVDKNFVLNRVPERFAENWIQDRRTPRFDRLQMRFHEAGYVRDAKAFAELLNKQHAEDYVNRAIDLASKGKLTTAMTAAERGLELDPDSVQSLIELADVLRQYALTADSQARKRILRNAGEHLDQALQIEPNNFEAILARAEIFRLQRDVENALQLLLKYLEYDPECWQVHAIVGRLFFHKQEHFEATKYLITAIDNRPTLPYVAGDLGYLYLLNRQFDDAQEFLRLALRLQPSEKNVKRNLAEAEFWLGNYEEAGKQFELIVESQPTLSHPKQMLAWLKATSPLANFRDGKAGKELIAPFVELKGSSSPSSLEIMAACLAELGDFDEALKIQRQVIEIVENNNSLENYTDQQQAAMRDRLELYKRQRPYRIEDPLETPLHLLGNS